MNELCPKCLKRFREKAGKSLRSTCWMCRVGHKANNKRNQEYRKSLRNKILAHYGAECRCCGENQLAFLAFDHVENDGNKFRKQQGSDSITFFRWIINNKFPKEIQVLCFNCNWGKHLNNGVCPHKMEG